MKNKICLMHAERIVSKFVADNNSQFLDLYKRYDKKRLYDDYSDIHDDIKQLVNEHEYIKFGKMVDRSFSFHFTLLDRYGTIVINSKGATSRINHSGWEYPSCYENSGCIFYGKESRIQ